MSEYDEHADKFEEHSFWNKITELAKSAGKEIVEKALLLFYSAQADRTPGWAKTTIYGALAYLIMPVDLIPDAIPVVGLADDALVIAAALGAVALYIDDDVKAMTQAKMKDWFGDDV